MFVVPQYIPPHPLFDRQEYSYPTYRHALTQLLVENGTKLRLVKSDSPNQDVGVNQFRNSKLAFLENISASAFGNKSHPDNSLGNYCQLTALSNLRYIKLYGISLHGADKFQTPVGGTRLFLEKRPSVVEYLIAHPDAWKPSPDDTDYPIWEDYRDNPQAVMDLILTTPDSRSNQNYDRVKSLVQSLNAHLASNLYNKVFPHEEPPCKGTLRYQSEFRYFEFVHPYTQSYLPENNSTDNIPHLLTHFKHRTKYVWTLQEELALVAYNRVGNLSGFPDHISSRTLIDPSLFSGGSHDLLVLPENMAFRYVSYWPVNNSVLLHYDPLEQYPDSSATQHFKVPDKHRLRDFYCFLPADRVGIKFVGNDSKVKKYAITNPKIIDPKFLAVHIGYIQKELNWSVSAGRTIYHNIPSLSRPLGPSKSTLQQAIIKSGLELTPDNFDAYTLRHNPHNRIVGIYKLKPDKEILSNTFLNYDYYLKLLANAKLQLDGHSDVVKRIIKKKRLDLKADIGSPEWQTICANLERNYKLDRLREIAITNFKADPAQTRKDSKRELCQKLAQIAEGRERRAIHKLRRIQKRVRRNWNKKSEHYKLPLTICSNYKSNSSVDEEQRTFQEMTAREYFVIVKPDLSVHCYHVNNLDWAKTNVMCKWERRHPDIAEDDIGYGLTPNQKIQFYPLPMDRHFRAYLDSNSFAEIKRAVDTSSDHQLQYFYLGDANLVKLGNCRGTFGISELHGQAPGQPVYSTVFRRQREIKPVTPPKKVERKINPEVKSQIDHINTQLGEITSRQNLLRPTYQEIIDRVTDLDNPDREIPESFYTLDELPIIREYRELNSQASQLARQRILLQQRLYQPQT